MRPDPWHYPRPELAQSYLSGFDPGPAEALTLFAERRSGKTSFLKRDLAPAAVRNNLQPVLIDLQSYLSDPAQAIANGFETAARAMQDPKYKLGGILNEEVTSVGFAGFSVGVKARTDAPAPTDTLSRISFWADQMMAASKRPVLLMVDEVQAIAEAPNSGDVAGALRATLQRHGRMDLRPVFTGSSRDGLLRMFNQSNAAFFHYGTSPEFPTPDDGFVRFMAERLEASSGVKASQADLSRAFEDLERRPGPFREMVEAMSRARSADVADYLERQIGQRRAKALARVAMDRLRPLERAVLDQVALTGSAYTAPAKQYYAEKLGVESVNNKSIVAAIDKLRHDYGLLRQVDRGRYRIDDPEVSDAIISQLPPPLQVQALTGATYADNQQPGNRLPPPSAARSGAKQAMTERAALKYQAREEGAAFLRPADRLYLPAPGIASKGEVIAVTEHYVYQRTGKTSITVHQVGQLDQERIPAVGEKLEIKYHHDQVHLEALQSRGRDQER